MVIVNLRMQKNIVLAALIVGWFQACRAQVKHLKVGDTVPIFSLQDQNNRLFSISDYIGKKILVIYFYPRDGRK